MFWILLEGLLINEVMNYPSDESCGEYIEIYNNSNDTIYLNGFKINDGEDIDYIVVVQNPPNYIQSRMFILPKEFTLIIDRDYFINCSINYNLFSNVLTVDDNAIGNGLSKNDSIYILNQFNDTIAKFEKPIPNVPIAHSIERINYEIDEWGISLNVNGTPNYQNSIFSNSFLKLDSAYLISNYLKIRIKNFSSQLFSDTIKVISKDTFYYVALINPNDNYEITISNPKSPKIEIISKNFQDYFYVPIFYPILIINEIEYDNNPEWIEIYNNSDIEIDLSKFSILDMAKNEFKLIGKIEPKGFKVFRADSFKDFISLNDNYESLILVSKFNFLFDSVYYTSSYGGKGTFTLEKINPSLKGYLKDSWKSSLIEFGTPNKINSVYIDSSSLNLEIFISNKKVRRGEILTISAYLKEIDNVDVYLFDDIGRLIEKVYSVKNTNRIIFNLNTQNLNDGMYILLFKGSKVNKKTYFRVYE
jgi:hypothetical protein